MSWFYLIFQIALVPLVFTCGLKVGKGAKKVWLPAALFAVMMLLVSRWICTRSDILFHYFPYAAVFFEHTFFVPFAIFFFALASYHTSTERSGKALLILNYLLVGYLLVYLSWIYLPSPKFNDAKWYKNVCLQTTGYSCGSASAVTLLKAYNISSNEREMAELTHTTSVWGTTVLRIAHAIQGKISGTKFKVELANKLDWEQAQKTPTPFIASVRYNQFMDHAVTILGFEGDVVVAGDPLEGIVRWSKKAFMEKWHKDAVYLR